MKTIAQLSDAIDVNVLLGYLAFALAMAGMVLPILVGRRIPGAIIGALAWTAAAWIYFTMRFNPEPPKVALQYALSVAPAGAFLGFFLGLLGGRLRRKRTGTMAGTETSKEAGS